MFLLFSNKQGHVNNVTQNLKDREETNYISNWINLKYNIWMEVTQKAGRFYILCLILVLVARLIKFRCSIGKII